MELYYKVLTCDIDGKGIWSTAAVSVSPRSMTVDCALIFSIIKFAKWNIIKARTFYAVLND